MGKCLIIITLLWNGAAFGWGKTGHRVVGEVAQLELSEDGKKFVSSIIGNESLAQISNYPDFLRSDPKMKKYNSWHYINIKKNQTFKKYTPSKKGDILVGIKTCLNKLKKSSIALKEKRFYLSYLVHLVGDLHQPLHVGFNKDKGGNLVKLKWFGAKVNLHQIWDEKLIDMQELSYTEYTKFLFNIYSNKSVYLAGEIKDWAQESHDYAKEVYNYDKKRYWEYHYNFAHKKMLDQRLYQAGRRLAVMINDLAKK